MITETIEETKIEAELEKLKARLKEEPSEEEKLTFPSSVFDREYREVGVLGHTDHSTVYLVEALERGQMVGNFALKQLGIRTMRGSKHLTRFGNQAHYGELLDHPNVVSMEEYEPGNGRFPEPFIVMEYLEGPTLREVLKTKAGGGKPLPLEEIVLVSSQILGALDHAHNLPIPIVHRDLKPENLMFNSEGIIKVVNFGAAKEIGNDSILTTGMASFQYMAPEQFGKHENNYYIETDFYSFGVVLYEMLTGKEMPRGNSLQHEIPDYANLGRFKDVIRKATQWNPEDRHGSASELLEAIVDANKKKSQDIARVTITPNNDLQGLFSDSDDASPSRKSKSLYALKRPDSKEWKSLIESNNSDIAKISPSLDREIGKRNDNAFLLSYFCGLVAGGVLSVITGEVLVIQIPSSSIMGLTFLYQKYAPIRKKTKQFLAEYNDLMKRSDDNVLEVLVDVKTKYGPKYKNAFARDYVIKQIQEKNFKEVKRVTKHVPTTLDVVLTGLLDCQAWEEAVALRNNPEIHLEDYLKKKEIKKIDKFAHKVIGESLESNFESNDPALKTLEEACQAFGYREGMWRIGVEYKYRGTKEKAAEIFSKVVDVPSNVKEISRWRRTKLKHDIADLSINFRDFEYTLHKPGSRLQNHISAYEELSIIGDKKVLNKYLTKLAKHDSKLFEKTVLIPASEYLQKK